MVKKNDQVEQRPERKETASEIAVKKWIEERQRIDEMYNRKVKPVKVKKGIKKTAAGLYAEEQGITIKEAEKRLAEQLRESLSKPFMDGVREGKKYAERMAGFQEGLREAEEARRDKVDLSKIEDEDKKQLIIRYQTIDELFDELLAKLLTFMEACGFCSNDDTAKTQGIRRTIKSTVREIQNRIKDEVPITEKMSDVPVRTK